MGSICITDSVPENPYTGLVPNIGCGVTGAGVLDTETAISP